MRGWLRPAGVGLIVIGVAALGLAVAGRTQDGNPTRRTSSAVGAALDAARPAVEPFIGMTATRVVVGTRPFDVVIADTEAERGLGLRRRRTIGRYGGMLFVYARATIATFTMSTVPVPLDIAFYDRDGRVVTRLAMQPCAGTDATCPGYRSRGAFRFALETLAGNLPRGRLRSLG